MNTKNRRPSQGMIDLFYELEVKKKLERFQQLAVDLPWMFKYPKLVVLQHLFITIIIGFVLFLVAVLLNGELIELAAKDKVTTQTASILSIVSWVLAFGTLCIFDAWLTHWRHDFHFFRQWIRIEQIRNGSPKVKIVDRRTQEPQSR